MWNKLKRLALVTALAAIAAPYAGKVLATPQYGFTGTTIAVGRFNDIDVANQLIRSFGDLTPRKDLWLSMQRTKGPSDLYVQSNEWAVGGSTGWHTHPGHSLIIVTEGSVTAYDADVPSCAPTVYTSKSVNGVANMGFVDPGGDHAHLLRNDGPGIARSVAVQLIPAGELRRIDIAQTPAGCSVN
jgi:hypothetical protein